MKVNANESLSLSLPKSIKKRLSVLFGQPLFYLTKLDATFKEEL
jgi:hypothetical protein